MVGDERVPVQREKRVKFYEKEGDTTRLGRGYIRGRNEDGSIIIEYHGIRFSTREGGGGLYLLNPADVEKVKATKRHMQNANRRAQLGRFF